MDSGEIFAIRREPLLELLIRKCRLTYGFVYIGNREICVSILSFRLEGQQSVDPKEIDIGLGDCDQKLKKYRHGSSYGE